MNFNDEELINRVNVFFTRASRTRIRQYKKKRKRKNKYFNQNSNLNTKCAIVFYHFKFAHRLNA